MNCKPISLAILREAIQIAKAGGTEEHPYNQGAWGDNKCGTSCCVGGFARLLAGQPIGGGLPDVEEHPAAKKIQSLMACPSQKVLFVMESVDDNGVIQLKGADLRGVSLPGANLAGANLAGANLAEADLVGANLVGASLAVADLRWANLYGADLYGADLTGANLNGARLPKGFVRDAPGYVLSNAGDIAVTLATGDEDQDG